MVNRVFVPSQKRIDRGGGAGQDWRHKFECIRINYSRDAQTVGRAIKIIGEEVLLAYSQNKP